MADEILVKYTVDASGFKAVADAVQNVTVLLEKTRAASKAAFSISAMQESIDKMEEVIEVTGEVMDTFEDTGVAAGQVTADIRGLSDAVVANAKALKEMQGELDKYKKVLGETSVSMKKLKEDSGIYQSIKKGIEGMKGGLEVTSKVLGAFGQQTAALDARIDSLTKGMEDLKAIEGGVADAIEGVTAVSETLTAVTELAEAAFVEAGVAAEAAWALATAGIAVVIAALVALAVWLYNTRDTTLENLEAQDKMNKSYGEEIDAINDAIAAGEKADDVRIKNMESKIALMKAQGKSEKKILQAEKQLNQERINSANDALKQINDSYKLNEKTIQDFVDKAHKKAEEIKQIKADILAQDAIINKPGYGGAAKDEAVTKKANLQAKLAPAEKDLANDNKKIDAYTGAKDKKDSAETADATNAKQIREQSLKDEIAGYQAKAIAAKENSAAQFKARREELDAEHKLELEQAGENEKEKELVNAKYNKAVQDLAKDQQKVIFEHEKEALQNSKNLIDARLLKVKQGTEEEKNLKIQAINAQRDLELHDAKKDGKANTGTIEKINANADKQVNDTNTAFTLKTKTDGLEAQIADERTAMNKITDINDTGAAHKKKILELQATENRLKIENEIKDETLKDAKLRELESKLVKDLKDIDKGEAQKKIDDQKKVIGDDDKTAQSNHDKVTSDPKSTDKRKFDADQALFDQKAASVKKLQDLNQQSFDSQLIGEKEFQDTKTQLQNDADKIQQQKEAEAEERRRGLINKTLEMARTGVNLVADLVKSILDGQLQAVQQSFDEQNKALDKWHENAVAGAGNNAVKKAAIERRYHAQQEKLQQQQAIKEAQIKRKQAQMDKATKIINIIITTAENVVKAVGSAPFPANIPAIAIAVATGAISAAAVAAQPLPPIPKFAKGGAVVRGGGRSDDGMLYGRSHQQGGMLLEAQGGEYIWDIPTVQKHGDIIKAAHQNRLEEMVFHKYIAPALQTQQAAARSAHESYDDFLLRTETKGVRHAVNQSTKHIVRAIRENNNGYLNSRYHA